jgi:hypothetical protein
MPSEYRQLLFSNNELIEALYEFNQVARTKLPPGMILSCTPVKEDKVAVRLQMMDQASGETQVVPLSSELVAAALLGYCIRHRIPIPRNAAKSIQVHGDQISLDLRVKGRRATQPVPAVSAAVDPKPQEG